MLPNCTIALVHPRDPNNIGAVARAMKNFGLSDLVVVAPHPPIWGEIVAAVNADDVIKSARVTNTLAEAIADCTVVIGTKDKTNFPVPKISPAHLAQFRLEKFALVFGSEKHGLTNEDLSHCHYCLSIPTSAECPSINLAQAVAICCYELQRDNVTEIPTQKLTAATTGEIEQALAHLIETLAIAGFAREENQSALTQELRQSLLKGNFSTREINLLRGALRQIQWKMENSQNKK